MADVIPGRGDLGNFRIFKKTELRFDCWSEQLGFSDLIRSDQFGSQPAEMSWDLRHHKMHRAWGRGSQFSMVSIDFYELCLSSRVAKNWEQKEINPFVSEITESVLLLLVVVVVVYNKFTLRILHDLSLGILYHYR